MTVHVGLCQTWSETTKTGLFASRLNYGNETLIGLEIQYLELHFFVVRPRHTSENSSTYTCVLLRKVFSYDLLLFDPLNNKYPDMTIAVDWDVKQFKSNKQNLFFAIKTASPRTMF